jgi:hypothetical protein
MSLKKLLKINGKQYEWSEEMHKLTGKTGSDYGVIAQEVQKEFPEMVLSGSDGYLRVDYIQLIPVMIEAIRELKEEIDQLKLNK